MKMNILIGVGFLAVMNLIAFFVMLWDKSRSRNKNNKRISEGTLFFMASFFGSFGVYAGMFAFRHKTRKWQFIAGIPLLMIQNLIFIYFLINFLT